MEFSPLRRLTSSGGHGRPPCRRSKQDVSTEGNGQRPVLLQTLALGLRSALPPTSSGGQDVRPADVRNRTFRRRETAEGRFSEKSRGIPKGSRLRRTPLAWVGKDCPNAFPLPRAGGGATPPTTDYLRHKNFFIPFSSRRHGRRAAMPPPVFSAPPAIMANKRSGRPPILLLSADVLARLRKPSAGPGRRPGHPGATPPTKDFFCCHNHSFSFFSKTWPTSGHATSLSCFSKTRPTSGRAARLFCYSLPMFLSGSGSPPPDPDVVRATPEQPRPQWWL